MQAVHTNLMYKNMVRMPESGSICGTRCELLSRGECKIIGKDTCAFPDLVNIALLRPGKRAEVGK